jgi:hypothetical protein
MTIQTRTLISVNGSSFWSTREQADAIATLVQTRKGGFARIYGYKATTGRTVPTVYDATVTTRFSYKRLVERKRAALEALTLNDILPHLAPKARETAPDTLLNEWNKRKASELASFNATGNDDRSDAHRQGHDRCYLNIADGVVVHYVTVRGNYDGLMYPVLTDGFPTADSIMLNCLEVSRTVREPGAYKTVNSGVPVLISNAIKATMKANGVRSMNRVSLRADNFESVSIDGNVVLPEDMVSLA